MSGVFPIPYPRVPGHEIVGEVAAVPASETKWKVGQRVGGAWHGGHCGSCARCKLGDPVTCAQQSINGACRRVRRGAEVGAGVGVGVDEGSAEEQRCV